MLEYLWDSIACRRLGLLKMRAHIVYQRFWDKQMKRLVGAMGENPIVCFGSGGAHGEFNRLPGFQQKRPVVRLRKLLAKRVPVIRTDEWRTSALCWRCSFPNAHQPYTLSRCTNPAGHGQVVDRDVDGAAKILYRFCMAADGLDLGPWQRGSVLPNPPVEWHGMRDFVRSTFPADDPEWQAAQRQHQQMP